MPKLYVIFARKNAKIVDDNCQKNNFPEFFGEALPLPPIRLSQAER